MQKVREGVDLGARKQLMAAILAIVHGDDAARDFRRGLRSFSIRAGSKDLRAKAP